MVSVTIREYKDNKCRATVENLRFPTMVHAEEFVDEFFNSYYGSGYIKATIEKIKEAPDAISFDDLEELVSHEDTFLELEEVTE